MLRALQVGEVDPVGASAPVQVDIRLISATNRDLEQMIRDGRFREDLFYRLSVFPMTLPPLRDRREDIPGLARMFLKRFSAAEQVPISGFSQSAMEMIAHAEWAGNVRQLENCIHRAVVLTDGPQIRPEDLYGLTPADGSVRGSGHNGSGGSTNPAGRSCREFMRDDGHIKRLLEVEQAVIEKALDLYRGRMSETARRLGIGRSTLYRKLDDYQIGRGPD